MHDLQLDYFAISETKLDDSFPSAQFAIENYEIRGRRDRNWCGGGLIEFIKRGKICKTVKQFETVISLSIYSESTISRKKWFCIYRSPDFNNLDTFFKEVSLSKARFTYENFIIIVDFNISVNTAEMEVDELDEFCNPFALTNLTKTEKCCTKNHKSTIDLF